MIIIIIVIIIIMTANLGVQNGYLLGNWVTDHGNENNYHDSNYNDYNNNNNNNDNDNNYDDNNITISQYSDLWNIEGQ